MKRFTTFTLYAVVSLLVIGLGAAAAQGVGKGQGARGDCDGPRSEMRMARMAEHLELSEEQVKAIEAVREESREAGRALHKDMARVRNEMQGERLKDQPSQKALLDLNAKLGELRTEVQAERIKMRFAVREQLTEEQQDKMLSLGEFGGRGHKGGRQGRGGCEGERGCGSGPRHCNGRGSNK